MSGPSCASVHHVTIAVTDLDESVGWHQTVLKAERESARRDAGASHADLRSADDTKNDNRFHGRRVIQWRTNDCVTGAFLKVEASHPHVRM